MADSELIDEPRAYAQWVVMIFNNVGTQDIKVKNLQLSMGKLYADGDKDTEISPSTYEDQVIHPGERLQINSCGEKDHPTGTTGELDIVDVTANDEVIRHFFWDCPWGSKKRTWTVSNPTNSEKWTVESIGAGPVGGALGTIMIDFLNKPGY